jgi:membrane-associated protease RseP (regulator of RpoE activity)
MFGDDPLSEEELSEEEKKVAYTHKSKWARFWIVFGGQLANFHVMPSARVEGGSEVLVPILRLHAKDFLQLCPPRVGSR